MAVTDFRTQAKQSLAIWSATMMDEAMKTAVFEKFMGGFLTTLNRPLWLTPDGRVIEIAVGDWVEFKVDYYKRVAEGEVMSTNGEYIEIRTTDPEAIAWSNYGSSKGAKRRENSVWLSRPVRAVLAVEQR
jgi:hypothetical protein